MSFTGELWGRTPPLEDPMPKPPEGGTTDLVIRQARIIHELRTELEALKKFTACTRSHPHEAMAQDCELRTEIARLTNELTRLRAAPVVPQGEPVAAWLKVKIEKHAMLAADCPGSSSVVLKSALLRFLDSLPPVAATPSPAPAKEVGLTDEEIKQACAGIYLSDHPQGSSSYDIALAHAIISALRAKGGKHV